MPIAITDKIVALLVALTPADIGALPPVERRRFAALCQHWGRIAERPVQPQMDARRPRSGVLLDLERRQQHE